MCRDFIEKNDMMKASYDEGVKSLFLKRTFDVCIIKISGRIYDDIKENGKEKIVLWFHKVQFAVNLILIIVLHMGG